MIFFSVKSYPWGAAYSRPLILVVLFRTLRQYCFRYMKVIYDSLPMVMVLYGYVIYYAWFGQKLYEGTLQGI